MRFSIILAASSIIVPLALARPVQTENTLLVPRADRELLTWSTKERLTVDALQDYIQLEKDASLADTWVKYAANIPALGVSDLEVEATKLYMQQAELALNHWRYRASNADWTVDAKDMINHPDFRGNIELEAVYKRYFAQSKPELPGLKWTEFPVFDPMELPDFAADQVKKLADNGVIRPPREWKIFWSDRPKQPTEPVPEILAAADPAPSYTLPDVPENLLPYDRLEVELGGLAENERTFISEGVEAVAEDALQNVFKHV